MTKTGKAVMVSCLVLALVSVAVAQQPDYMPGEWPKAKKMTKAKADIGLKELEAELADQLAEVHNKLEKMGPESDDAEEAQKHAHMLMGKLEAVRREMGQVEQRSELEMVLKKHVAELAQMREHNPDSPQIRELEEKIEHLERELKADQKRKPRKMAARPRMDLVLKIFQIEHAPADHILEVVEPFAGEGSVVSADPRTNILIVRAHPHFVEEIHEIIKHIDRSASPVWRRLAEQEMERELQMAEMRMMIERHRYELENRIFDDEHMEHDEEDTEHDEEGVDEHPTVHITVRPGEEGMEFFLQEERVSTEQLHERLDAIDVPAEWRLLLHVWGEVSEEMIHHMLETAEEQGFREIKVEHRKMRVKEEHEAEEHEIEHPMEHEMGEEHEEDPMHEDKD